MGYIKILSVFGAWLVLKAEDIKAEVRGVEQVEVLVAGYCGMRRALKK